MRFTVSQSALQKALAVVAKGASSNTTMPIIAGVLLRASEGTLELQTTDLAISIRHRIAANVEEAGETVVSAKMITNIVKNLPDAPITFDGAGSVLEVSCDRTIRYTLNTLPSQDFPAFPEVSPESSVELPLNTLSEMVDRVFRVTSKDTSRAALCGILLSVEENLVRLVACDSYRLAVVDAHVETSSLSAPFDTIVPGQAFRDAVSAMSGEETALVGVTGTQVLFSAGTTTFVSRRIEGSYPDYNRLIPSSCTTSVRLPVEPFSDALRRVSLLATTNPSVRLDVDVDGGLVTMSSGAVDAGEARVEVDAPGTGENLTIALNDRYLGECLTALSGETELDLELQSSMKPAVFKSYGAINYLYLVMPVHL